MPLDLPVEGWSWWADNDSTMCTWTTVVHTQVTWLIVTRSEAQASGWCCMRSTFLQLLFIFSSPEGYQLQFSIPHVILCIQYGTVLANTAVLCMHHLFAGTWRPLMSVVTTLIMLRLFFIVECGIACFLCAMRVFEVRRSSSYPKLLLCQISFLSRPPLLS